MKMIRFRGCYRYHLSCWWECRTEYSFVETLRIIAFFALSSPFAVLYYAFFRLGDGIEAVSNAVVQIGDWVWKLVWKGMSRICSEQDQAE